jgi:integrase
MPRITLHGLRHTSASLQIASGVPIEVVSKRLRHANSGITSSTYAHLVGDAGSQAAEAIANLVNQHRRTVQ